MTKAWNFIAIKYSTNYQTGNWQSFASKKEANQYIGEENQYGNGIIFSTRKAFLEKLESVRKEVGSGKSHMRGLYNAMLSAEKYFSDND